MARQNMIQSLNSATEGFIHVIKTQRNMRFHFLLATFIIVLGIYFNIPKTELIVLMGSLIFVLALEMVNTSVELTVDLIKNVYHPTVRIIKDVTAGAVLLAAINAATVVYMIFSKRFAFHIEDGVNKITHSSWHLTFIAFILVILVVVFVKVLFHKGTPFRGGIPSGHAAFAFSLWTIIIFSTKNGLIAFLSFVMAFLIARQRLNDNIHTVWEVIAGALLGIFITALVFQLLL